MSSKKEPIRIGIAGLGRAGWGMHCSELKKYEDRFRIVAGCDPMADRRLRMQREYGAAPYRRIEDMIADPDVEMIDIATRSNDHLAHARMALAADKIVFLEKPMCVSLAEAVELRKAAARRPGKLFIRHNRRFEPAFQHIREIIDSGILGTIHSITLRRGGYNRRDDWQTLRRFGGGQLLNWGPHIVDHALQFLGTAPTSIWSDLKRVTSVGDAEDLVRIVMRNAAGRVVDLEISSARALKEPEYIVCGAKGTLQYDGRQIHLRHLRSGFRPVARRAKASTPPEGGFGSPDKLEWTEQSLDVAPRMPSGTDTIWAHLYAAVREKVPFPVKVEEAVAVMRVISTVRRGTPFTLES